jgi:hypothetical protein
MNAKDAYIAEILTRYGEAFADSVWRVQSNAVIYHKTLERIAIKAQIQFDPPTILRAERDEAVVMVTGRMGDRYDWDIGEALVGVNYRVSGKQAAYVYAMAMKRARDRLILKLIELSGDVYSEEEADDFKRGGRQEGDEAPREEAGVEADLKARIRKAATINAVTDFMLLQTTQAQLGTLTEEGQLDVREFAKARLVELGWPPKRSSR